MTEVKHAGGLVSSSKVPALHLIPTEALMCLADRFEVGSARKGDGAWNALTKNQQCLDDNAFLIERCSHIIRHTMLLRDQLAQGYNPEQEDSPYENAGAIIFGGALMACAMHRRGECITCGVPFTQAEQVACKDCLKYAYESTGCPVEPVESPDDWVVQDRVPARVTDRSAWVDVGEPYPPYDFRSRHWSTVLRGKVRGMKHGAVDDVGRTLHLICRRKDLPGVVDLDNPPMPAPTETEAVDQLYPPHADASFICRNHGVVHGLEFNPAQKMWFWGKRSDVCWDLYGKARRISLDMTDAELRGFDIVNKIHMHPHEE